MLARLSGGKGIRSGFGLSLLWIVTVFTQSLPAVADSLDREINRLNADVAALEESLIGLEQNILHPASTRMSVFLTLAREDAMELDSIEIYINDQPVASHLYNASEQGSLEQGSIQELYVGNLTNGEHTLRAVLTAQSSRNHYVRREASHRFRKAPGEYRLQLVLDASPPDFEPKVTFREWK